MSERESVVVIHSEASPREAIARRLEQAGFTVRGAASVREGAPLIQQFRPRLVILRYRAELHDLAEVVQTLRWDPATLIFLLTGEGDALDAAVALEAGADQCLALPASLHELLAHVQALLRRRPPATARRPGKWVVGDLAISPSPRHVTLRGREVPLTAKEFEILVRLAQESDRVVRREELLRHVWPDDLSVRPQTLDVHVFSLRRKIEEDPARPSRLLTVRGIGYRLVDGAADAGRTPPESADGYGSVVSSPIIRGGSDGDALKELLTKA